MNGLRRTLTRYHANIICQARRTSTTAPRPRFQPDFDPYLYTQGRWLGHDEERRQARELRFDFDALLDTAIRCSPGAQQVVKCEKREGGFNRVFMITLDNGKDLVARLPTRIAGPPGLTTSSEVATMKFVKERTKVPVSHILSSSSEVDDNPVGAEYIIMDAMPGVALKDVWNNMTASQHIRCIKSICYLCKELCSLSFRGYGSLFLRANSPQGAIPLDDKYSIGPLCAPHRWGLGVLEKSTETTPSFLGPWLNINGYLSDLVLEATRSARTLSPDLELLGILKEAQKMIVESGILKTAADPTLMHPDFHTRNIFVDAEDPTIVTGIIDWQAAAIEPAFVYAANTPDFAEEIEELPYDKALELDDKSEELSPQARLQADVQFCIKIWTLMVQLFPKYNEASALDPLLINVMAAGSTGWLRDTVSLRLLLKDLSEKWQELGLPGQSLYSPSEEEAKRFEDQLDRARATQQLKSHLSRLLHCDTDGWVPAERWEQALSGYRAEYSRFLASVNEDGQSDAERAAAIASANDM